MKFHSVFRKLGLMFLGVLFFSFCQPSVILSRGFGPVAFFALVPFFILASILPLKTVWLWSGVYGALAHVILVFWLWDFSKIAFFGVAILYFFFFAILGILIRLSVVAFSENAFIANWLLYLGYEFLKTAGFLGFSYGLMASSQWKFIPLIQVASVFGVWAISALVIFPSSFLATFAVKFTQTENSFTFSQLFRKFSEFIKDKKFYVLGYSLIFILSFIPSFLNNFKTAGQYKIVLIQPNSDPWKVGVENYGAELETLLQLSEKAIAENPDLDLVVWPETAFIPRIKWHYKFRQDSKTFALVDKLLTFVNCQSVAFLIGNDEAFYDPALARGKTGLEAGRVDYNAALLFMPGINVIPPEPEVYYKQKLVPFTESFPYKKNLPFVYELLKIADTHFYEAGTEAKSFEVDGLKFSVPICFEDNFGYLTRKFAQNGAQVLVNISNDAWAKSLACQMQHLCMGVFRSIETGLPLLRSTANGITCYVDSCGRVLEQLEPFSKGALTVNCKVPEKSDTLYLKIGDFLGYVFLIGGIVSVFWSLVVIFNKRKKNG